MAEKIQERGKNKDYEQKIEDAIGKKEFEMLSRGYDLLGDIAIIEFKGKKSSERKIASVLMETNSNIKTVLAKVGAVSGKYRVRKVRHVGGKKTFVANYRENGCLFRFDVRKVYFSNRLSFERSRILSLVKNKENVMVMFAGVGPFAIEIGKKFKDANVVAIELNKHGYNYMVENIKLNKLNNVEPILGDVKKIKKYSNFADRIIMPLPKSSLNYLDDAYRIAKKRSIIHLYTFSNQDKQIEVINAIKENARKRNYKVKILNKRTVRPYSTSTSEIVVDYLILK